MINWKKKYRHIFIIESRNFWLDDNEQFDLDNDLILTLDFGLKNLIENLGGKVFYIDSLCSPDEMQKNNILATEFLKKWHYDKLGKDIFTENNVPFGFSFRIEIWSEIFYYVRLRASINQLEKLKYIKIFLAERNDFMKNILYEIGLNFVLLDKKNSLKKPEYFFDIQSYMFNALHAKNLKNITKKILIFTFSNIRFFLDMFIKKSKQTIYAQIYYPTRPIINDLLKNPNIRVVTSSLLVKKVWNIFSSQRLIPIRGSKILFENKAIFLFSEFKKKRCAKIFLADGTDISDAVYKIIESQIIPRIPESLNILSSTINYLEKYPIHFQLMVANLGLGQTIVDSVLKTKKVPSYLIINGLMTSSFSDEAKYASYINCYGPVIKKNYYQNARNVICLGDPRMDYYSIKGKKSINIHTPVVTIGTSGFNNIDLNSYVAVEFDFMYEVLTAFNELKKEGQIFSIIIKIRSNGVLNQYKSFVKEYFSELDAELLRDVPINDVLERTDLYISIYSQTLFEASCLGIPAIYYKKDKEYLNAPFNRKSELVTVNSVDGLKQAFIDFKSSNYRFKKFLDKKVMEKYIGPLDGKNKERNIDYIYRLLDIQNKGMPH